MGEVHNVSVLLHGSLLREPLQGVSTNTPSGGLVSTYTFGHVRRIKRKVREKNYLNIQKQKERKQT